MKELLRDFFSEKWKRRFRNLRNYIDSGKQNKIFGIGLGKTGTTSLKSAMEELGYTVGDQRTGELLMDDWAKRDFKSIVRFCKTADFFQDQPFSKPYTYIVMDQAYPNSKFILTVRDSAEQWYNSITKFHAKLWGKNGRVPTKEDLQNAEYVQRGWVWEINRMSYPTPESDPYRKKNMIEFYQSYNSQIKEYFRFRPEDLLVLNVAKEESYKKLCDFLGEKPVRDDFPWKNKTSEV